MKWPIGKLKKFRGNPVLIPSRKNKWESAAVYNGTAVRKLGKVYLFYRAEQHYYNDYVSKIGLAISRDGFRFKRLKKPIIVPERIYEKRGCEDPRICQINEKYYMTYVAFSGRRTNIALAESEDLINWRKKGTLIRYSKSGALVSGKIDGKYILYFGDTNIYMAFSKNLKKWEISNEPVLTPRPNKFDSRLVEVGPCPIVTPKGIFMVYNSSNGREYNVGYAMFSKNNPKKCIARTDKPQLSATHPWENFGKVNYVVFAEGLVEKNGEYLEYYGGADKSIGVATGGKKY
jgi:predicted GH43/DUF377 family glycosyl hydrolase